MLKKFITNLFFLSTIYSNLQASNEDLNINKLLNSYPNFLKSYENNIIKFHDNSEMKYDDNIIKRNYEELLNNPSIKDQMSIPYLKVVDVEHYEPRKNEDSGRIRNEAFFKKMYGSNIDKIRKNLVKIKWMPKTSNKIIWVTKINDIDKKFELISQELDELPNELKKFLDNPSGGFNYRKIANTNRLSTHSYGIAIDINVENSDYWNWDEKFEYKNKIPLEIVKIFEKHGFIWGGRWYHYDTMHFEYRPELLN